MQTRAELIAPCNAGEVFAHVADLSSYPQWMGGLVHSVVRHEDEANAELAWEVELRSRIGPLARSKKLRMVRTEFVEGRLAVFERREVDGREHSVWRLEARVIALNPAESVTESVTDSVTGEVNSHLVMTMTYEGRLWTGGILEKVLQDEIDSGRDQLLAILTQTTP
jgi:hypothetical protein